MKERIKTIVFWILLAFTAAAAMVTPWACANKKENNSEKETMVESQEAAEGTIVGDGAGLNNVGFAKSLDGENVEKAQEQAERSVVRLDVQGNGAEYFGSGVIWDVTEEGIVIVTSRHLLEEGELLRVVLPDGRETSGKTEGLCQVKDIGFVVVPEDLPEKEKVNGASSDAAEKTMLVVSLHQRIFDTLDAESPLVVLGCSEAVSYTHLVNYQPDKLTRIFMQCIITLIYNLVILWRILCRQKLRYPEKLLLKKHLS